MPSWERRDEIGFFVALLRSIKEILFYPKATFSGLSTSDTVGGPLLYAVTLGAVCTSIPLVLMLSAILSNHHIPASEFMTFAYLAVVAPFVLAAFAVVMSVVAINYSLIFRWSKAEFSSVLRVQCYSASTLFLAFELSAICWTLAAFFFTFLRGAFPSILVAVVIATLAWYVSLSSYGLHKAIKPQTWRPVTAYVLTILLCLFSLMSYTIYERHYSARASEVMFIEAVDHFFRGRYEQAMNLFDTRISRFPIDGSTQSTYFHTAECRYALVTSASSLDTSEQNRSNIARIQGFTDARLAYTEFLEFQVRLEAMLREMWKKDGILAATIELRLPEAIDPELTELAHRRIAQCYDGELAASDALSAYKKFLETYPNSLHRDEIAERISELSARDP